VMPSPPGRSTGPSRNPLPRRGGVDVYLLPAVVGGGLGDIEEVLAAGRRLRHAGYRVVLYRRPGHPLPRSVEGPWDWPSLERTNRLVPKARAALTIAPAWGLSATPGRPGRLGRGGAWAEEVADIERAYGPDGTLHVSLEEFARTLDSRRETRERLREGGVPSRVLSARTKAVRDAGEVEAFRRAFVRFRAFDRPNVLHLFATFRPDRAFAREFPNAVQTGPLWPGRHDLRSKTRVRSSSREWVWYASPVSAERIAPSVLEGLNGLHPPVTLYVRAPRPWPTVPASDRLTLVTEPVAPNVWCRRFAAAELRIVTGSRTLLEALEVGGPFLYFNGVLGKGRRARAHRPEKLRALLAVGRSEGVPAPLLADLRDFARGRRVIAVVRRLAGRTLGWERFHPRAVRTGFEPPFDDAGALILAVARALAQGTKDAPTIVRRVRAGLNYQRRNVSII
jgi:hypothetical protein